MRKQDDLLKEVDKMGWDGLNPEFKEEYVMLERSVLRFLFSEFELLY